MNNHFKLGKPLNVIWHFKRPDGENYSLAGLQHELVCYNSRGRFKIKDSVINVEDTGVLSFTLKEEMQTVEGAYSFHLYLLRHGKTVNTIVKNDAVILSKHIIDTDSIQEDEPTTIDIFSVGEFELFRPTAPVAGSDGWWYFDGQPILDNEGDKVPINVTIDIDDDPESETFGIITLDKGRDGERETKITGMRNTFLKVREQGDKTEAQGIKAERQGNTAESQGNVAEGQGNVAEGQGNVAEEQGLTAKAQGEKTEQQGNIAEEQGNTAKQRGEKAEQQGNTAEAQGNVAEQQGLTAKAQGERAEAQGNTTEAQGMQAIQIATNKGDEAISIAQQAANTACTAANNANTAAQEARNGIAEMVTAVENAKDDIIKEVEEGKLAELESKQIYIKSLVGSQAYNDWEVGEYYITGGNLRRVKEVVDGIVYSSEIIPFAKDVIYKNEGDYYSWNGEELIASTYKSEQAIEGLESKYDEAIETIESRFVVKNDITSHCSYVRKYASILEDGAISGNGSMEQYLLHVKEGDFLEIQTFAYVPTYATRMYAIYNSTSEFGASTFIEGSEFISPSLASAKAYNITIGASAKALVILASKGQEFSVKKISNIDLADTVNKDTLAKGLENVVEKNPTKNILYIKKDGSGDYIDVQSAINSITDASIYNQYELRLCDDYEILSATELWKVSTPTEKNNLANPTEPCAYIVTKDYVNIVGYNYRRKVSVQMPYELDGNSFKHIQTMYLQGNCVIDNIDFELKNGRYAVHQESGGLSSSMDYNAITIIRNSNIVHLGNDDSADGGKSWPSICGQANGTCSGLKLIYENVTWKPMFYIHNNPNFDAPNHFKFKNCSIISDEGGTIGGYINSYGCGQNPVIECEGCNFLSMNYNIDVSAANKLSDACHDLRTSIPTYIGTDNRLCAVTRLILTQHALGFKTTENNKSVEVVGGTAIKDIWGHTFVKYQGASDSCGFVVGTEYVKDYAFALGKRLGNCQSTVKSLVISLNGVNQTITFNKDYTYMGNSDVVAEINSQLVGVTAILGVDKDNAMLMFPFNDIEEYGHNYSSSTIFSGTPLTRELSQSFGWRICTPDDKVEAVSCERINPNESGRVVILKEGISFTSLRLKSAANKKYLKVGSDGYFVGTDNKSDAVLAEYSTGYWTTIEKDIVSNALPLSFNGFSLPKNPISLKILAVGNSFAAMPLGILPAWLNNLGVKEVTYGIVVKGGGSLQDHYNGLNQTYEAKFTLSKNVNGIQGGFVYVNPETKVEDQEVYIKLSDAFAFTDWDIITFQQNSGNSANWDTIEPYLPKLIEAARYYCPNAGMKIGWQQTWAYANGYGSSTQDSMYKGIVECSKKVERMFALDLIIPNGVVMQNLRSIPNSFWCNDLLSIKGNDVYSASNPIADFCIDGLHPNTFACYCLCAAFVQLLINSCFNKTIRNCGLEYDIVRGNYAKVARQCVLKAIGNRFNLSEIDITNRLE